MTTPAPPAPRVPAVWLVVASILSVQVGAAIAKHLFPLVPPDAMVWLRLVSSSIILLAIVRPRLRGRTRADWMTAAVYGAALTAMNWSIYHAFARIPLGLAVTIEFLGPLSLAILGSRRPRDILWVVLAGAGVLMLGFSPTRLDPVGVAFALVAGLCWALYILFSARTGVRWSGLDGLAVASIIGAVVLAGPAVTAAGSRLLDPAILAMGVAVGVLSSVLPYSLELVALRTMPARVFGILMSLEPAAAALAGLILLHERLGLIELAALVCVVVASVGATRSQSTSPSSSSSAK